MYVAIRLSVERKLPVQYLVLITSVAVGTQLTIFGLLIPALFLQLAIIAMVAKQLKWHAPLLVMLAWTNPIVLLPLYLLIGRETIKAPAKTTKTLATEPTVNLNPLPGRLAQEKIAA